MLIRQGLTGQGNAAVFPGGRASRARRRPVALGSLLIALLWLCPGLSQAADESAESAESDYARSGVYLGLGVVGASYTRADDTLDDSDFDEAAGVQIVVGLRANAHVAAEIEVELLHKADVDLDGVSGEGEMHATSATLNLKGYPLTGRVQPYALFGLGGLVTKLEQPGESDDTPSGFVTRFGGGVEIYLTPRWVLDFGVDYLLPVDSQIKELDYVSYGGGVAFRF